MTIACGWITRGEIPAVPCRGRDGGKAVVIAKTATSGRHTFHRIIIIVITAQQHDFALIIING